MGWIYHESRDNGVWTVGYFRPPTQHIRRDMWEWVGVEDLADELEARRLCNYLNGGEGKGYPKRTGPGE
jgi:hypothetical protein